MVTESPMEKASSLGDDRVAADGDVGHIDGGRGTALGAQTY